MHDIWWEALVTHMIELQRIQEWVASNPIGSAIEFRQWTIYKITMMYMGSRTSQKWQIFSELENNSTFMHTNCEQFVMQLCILLTISWRPSDATKQWRQNLSALPPCLNPPRLWLPKLSAQTTETAPLISIVPAQVSSITPCIHVYKDHGGAMMPWKWQYVIQQF